MVKTENFIFRSPLKSKLELIYKRCLYGSDIDFTEKVPELNLQQPTLQNLKQQ